MKYLLYTIYIVAACAIVGCKGTHREDSPRVAELVKFDDLGEDAYLDEEDSLALALSDSVALEGETAENDTVGNDSTAADTVTDESQAPQPVATQPVQLAQADVADDERSTAPFDGVVHRMKVHSVGRSLREVFNDSNAVHLDAARALGFEPITDLRTAYAITTPIREVRTCKDFHIDKLSHSMPYLVPEAERLLHDIGRSFSDTIRARGGKRYKIKVTSLTRTDVTVRRLRRRNSNATQESAHRYGTTFDISYSKFICCDSSYVIHEGDLKNILAEVLYRLRSEGRCYVKWERKQGCFHITTRPVGRRPR
ncbi:MAG: DUF5715 family protein [Muribaculaceae bacterium]